MTVLQSKEEPERSNRRSGPCSKRKLLLRLAELEHRLVREAAHAGREHHLAVVIVGMGEHLALGNELEARGRHFLLDDLGVDAMERLRVTRAGTRRRIVIDYEEHTARLQRL